MIEQCPACGSHVLYEVELDYAGSQGFMPDTYGRVPEVGDTIAGCRDCGGFTVLDTEGNAAGAPDAPPADQAEHQAADGEAEQPAASEPPAPLMAVPGSETSEGGEHGQAEGT